jgi:hypothetical protein
MANERGAARIVAMMGFVAAMMPPMVAARLNAGRDHTTHPVGRTLASAKNGGRHRTVSMDKRAAVKARNRARSKRRG